MANVKKGLKHYSHDVNSHNHWKFKTLRKKYLWCGEGKFWAFNNLIAASDDCVLDLSDEDKCEQIAHDLDFEMKDFLEFILYLEKKCKLIQKVDGGYISKTTQEDLEKVEKTREYDRDRKSTKVK